jgi:hypothetical protein
MDDRMVRAAIAILRAKQPLSEDFREQVAVLIEEQREAVFYWNSDARRLSGCLIAIHQAPETATINALKSVAYDAALNCISQRVAQFQIERRSLEEVAKRNADAEREADAREA